MIENPSLHPLNAHAIQRMQSDTGDSPQLCASALALIAKANAATVVRNIQRHVPNPNREALEAAASDAIINTVAGICTGFKSGISPLKPKKD